MQLKKKKNWTSQWLYFSSFYTNKALRESTTPFCHSEASALLQIPWKLWVVGTGDPFPAGNFCRSSSREKSNNQTVSLQSSGMEGIRRPGLFIHPGFSHSVTGLSGLEALQHQAHMQAEHPMTPRSFPVTMCQQYWLREWILNQLSILLEEHA